MRGTLLGAGAFLALCLAAPALRRRPRLSPDLRRPNPRLRPSHRRPAWARVRRLPRRLLGLRRSMAARPLSTPGR